MYFVYWYCVRREELPWFRGARRWHMEDRTRSTVEAEGSCRCCCEGTEEYRVDGMVALLCTWQACRSRPEDTRCEALCASETLSHGGLRTRT